eukprot:6185114-Pleurochrysis_carterae.AAC.2
MRAAACARAGKVRALAEAAVADAALQGEPLPHTLTHTLVRHYTHIRFVFTQARTPTPTPTHSRTHCGTETRASPAHAHWKPRRAAQAPRRTSAPRGIDTGLGGYMLYQSAVLKNGLTVSVVRGTQVDYTILFRQLSSMTKHAASSVGVVCVFGAFLQSAAWETSRRGRAHSSRKHSFTCLPMTTTHLALHHGHTTAHKRDTRADRKRHTCARTKQRVQLCLHGIARAIDGSRA